MSKNILKSKTFWLAVIPIVVGVLQYIEGSLTQGTALTLYGVIMVVVRFLTTDSVYIPGLKKE